ncbi:MAG: DMP19 family protein [Acidobacteria bacterium]|nr:DMP19 family protein [Acidobacteriota bacterium]
MSALSSGGREAGEQLVDSLVVHGYTLERLDALPCMWRVSIPSPRVLEIWFTGGDTPVVAAVSYRVGKPWGSEAQRRAAKLQAEFYRRYELLSLRDGALPPDDRLIQLIGAFEADVSNGGFGQYLANHGAACGREALACLSAIGAKRTAKWLNAALGGRLDTDGLARLDQHFNEKAEDLASLTMIYLGRRQER